MNSDNMKYIMISDAMIALGSELVTTREIVGSLRELAKANWGDEAKKKLEELGLKTESDLHEFMQVRFADSYIEDPEGEEIYDSPIIA